MTTLSKGRDRASFAVISRMISILEPAHVAQKLGNIGCVTAGVATIFSPCTVSSCSMTSSVSFAPTGSPNAVYLTVANYRTARAGGTSIGTTDVLTKSWTSASHVIAAKSTASGTFAPAARGYTCLSVATTAYGYYTKASATNLSSIPPLMYPS